MKHCLSKHLMWSQHMKSNHQHMQDQPRPKHAMPRQPQCVPSHRFAINIQLPWKPYKCKNHKIQSIEIKNTIIIKCRKKRQQVKIAKHHTKKMIFFYPDPPQEQNTSIFTSFIFYARAKKWGETEFIGKLISSSYFDSCLDTTCIQFISLCFLLLFFILLFSFSH